MKYTIPGKGEVTLIGADFMASGGEAQIFKQNKMIYKIYHNPKDMIPDGKIEELQNIKTPKVLIPKDILLDSKGVRVGFTMDFVDGVTPLCQLFTNTYINQNNVSNDTMIELVKQMQVTINQIHAAKCIQVDGNELNYLVDEKAYKECYFIDVNSYQTKSFPATVIMPSIRDWTAKAFNELTDWYSFAIISCQLFIGIHPFKGKHDDFKRHDMQKRMESNISVFNKGVRVPSSVRDFSFIPTNYMDWYLNVFEKGKREMPPSMIGQAKANIKYIVIASTDNFNVKEVAFFDDVILYHSNVNQISVTRTKKSIYVGKDQYTVSKGVYLVHTPKTLIPVLVKIENGKLVIKSLSKLKEVKLGSEMGADELFIVDNTIYIKVKGSLIETRFLETGSVLSTPILLLTKTVWSISENSSRLFKSLIVQDLLGSKHISIPTPKMTGSTLNTIRIPELDGYKVLDAKYENRIVVLSLFNQKTNEYGLMVICDVENSNRHIRHINTVDYNRVNFTVLDNGIVILMYDDQLEMFINKVTTSIPQIKIIKDKTLNSDMSLCKRGMTARFFSGKKLYSIGMK